MTIRAAILCGVSSDAQAREDKASIPDQIRACRNYIETNGATEAGLYVMPGFSRTGYDSLADAMNDIPDLKRAVDAAANNEYDVLLLDNWDRLGDIGQLLYTRFRWKLRKQLHSIRQSGKLQDPANYDPKLDTAGSIGIHVQGILQTYRIDKQLRNIEIGVQQRVEDGKYSYGFPTGFTKTGWDEATATLIIYLEAEFMKGATLDQLEVIANASGIKPKRADRWRAEVIRGILMNPFYAGKVFNHRYRRLEKRISAKGKRVNVMRPNKDAKMYDGAHEPLWSWDEHLRILEELQDRYEHMARHNVKNFSGLLRCGICDKPMKLYNGTYACYPLHPDPIRLTLEQVDEQIGPALVKALKDYDEVSQPKQEDIGGSDTIAAIDREIAKVQDLVIKELFTETEGKRKIDVLRAKKKFIQDTNANQGQKTLRLANFLSKRQQLLPEIDELPILLKIRTPEDNNRFLRGLVRRIIVGNGEYTFIWKL